MEVTKTKNPEIWLKFLENRKCAKTTGFSLPSFVLFWGDVNPILFLSYLCLSMFILFFIILLNSQDVPVIQT